MMSVIASMLEGKEEEEIAEAIDTIVDPAGTFYGLVYRHQKSGENYMKQITIDPVTRLEGHGKIEIFCNDDGEVENVYFQVPELRGFEKFCEGRPIEEVSQIVTKICGVCPGCHHMAAGKAADMVFGVEPTSAAKKIRELFYMAHFVHSHIAHFYALGAPDFVVGPTATESRKKHPRRYRKSRKGDRTGSHQTATECTGDPGSAGRSSDPCGLNVPGGVRKGLKEEERKDVVEKAKGFVEFPNSP